MKADQPTEEGYAAAAWLLMADVRALKAIAEIEAGPEGAFQPDGAPTILFERHVFHRLTRGFLDSAAPDLSNPLPGGYGSYGSQHTRLQRAIALDREVALKSCSWGLYQIMGENHAAAGFPVLQRFVTAMYRSVDDHLRALVMFIWCDGRLVDAVRAKDWTSFAYVYNGPAYRKNRYAERIDEAYERLA